MSPRVVPKAERDALAMMGTIPVGSSSSDGELVNSYVQGQALERQGKCTAATPYVPGCSHSYFRDLLLVAESESRKDKAIESPVLRGRDQGSLSFDDTDLDAARERLRTAYWVKDRSQRDLSSATAGEGPTMPGYLVEHWGQASRAAGSLEAAFGTVPLEPGMLDMSGSVPLVKIPRLSGGAGVAVQSADNQAVQETDPTTASLTSPVGTVGGQTDLSRQLLEMSAPGIDRVIVDDLSRAHAQRFDLEAINGTATGGSTRGVLSTSGILSVSGSVTSASTFLISLWQGYSAVAGPSGFGASNPDDFVTILSPRRAAWLKAGVSGAMPPQSQIPGQLVVSAGIPTNLGGGTNEDVALVCAKSQVLLFSRGPSVRVFEEVGSATMTVRVRAHRYLAVLIKNPAAVCKVTGLTAPSGF